MSMFLELRRGKTPLTHPRFLRLDQPTHSHILHSRSSALSGCCIQDTTSVHQGYKMAAKSRGNFFFISKRSSSLEYIYCAVVCSIKVLGVNNIHC